VKKHFAKNLIVERKNQFTEIFVREIALDKRIGKKGIEKRIE